MWLVRKGLRKLDTIELEVGQALVDLGEQVQNNSHLQPIVWNISVIVPKCQLCPTCISSNGSFLFKGSQAAPCCGHLKTSQKKPSEKKLSLADLDYSTPEGRCMTRRNVNRKLGTRTLQLRSTR